MLEPVRILTPAETRRQVRREELLNLLLMRVPIPECAKRLGVNPRTLMRDTKNPEFAAEFELLSRGLRSRVMSKVAEENSKVARKLAQKKLAMVEKKMSLTGRINQVSGEAIDKLQELIKSEHQGLALKACDSVLDRNAETARCQHVESDVRSRFSIDPATLMHIAMTAKEIEEPGEQEVLPPAIEGEVSQEVDDGG